MTPDTFRLRMTIRESRSLSSGEKNGCTVQKNGETVHKNETNTKKKMSDVHGCLFILMGISMAVNLNASLLTEKVFHCKNFANKCVFIYMFFALLASVSSFLCTLNFTTMIMSGWTLVLSQVIHVIVGMFGNGTMARNIFILCYGIIGAMEAFTIFAAANVVAKLFLNSTFSLIFTGFPAGKIIMGTIQAILNRMIGSGTLSQMRTSLVLCHTFHAVISAIGYIWATLLYIKYGRNGSGSGEDVSKPPGERFSEVMKNISFARLYYSRLILVILAQCFRYFFFPCLVPFILDITQSAKLICSLAFIISEFIGMMASVGIDETIDPSEKDPSQSHSHFLLTRDIYLHILGCTAIGLPSLLLWSSVSTGHSITRSPGFIFFFSILMGLTYGHLSTRSINGCKPVLQYYNKLGDYGGENVTDEIANGSGASSVVNMVINVAFLPISILSNILEGVILRHKSSRAYILRNGRGNLSAEAVNALLMQF